VEPPVPAPTPKTVRPELVEGPSFFALVRSVTALVLRQAQEERMW